MDPAEESIVRCINNEYNNIRIGKLRIWGLLSGSSSDNNEPSEIRGR